MIIPTPMSPIDLINARRKDLKDQLDERKGLLTAFRHDARIVEIQIQELEAALVVYDKWLREQNGSDTTASS